MTATTIPLITRWRQEDAHGGVAIFRNGRRILPSTGGKHGRTDQNHSKAEGLPGDSGKEGEHERAAIQRSDERDDLHPQSASGSALSTEGAVSLGVEEAADVRDERSEGREDNSPVQANERDAEAHDA